MKYLEIILLGVVVLLVIIGGFILGLMAFTLMIVLLFFNIIGEIVLIVLATTEFILYKTFSLVWDMGFGWWASWLFKTDLNFLEYNYANWTTKPHRNLKSPLNGDGLWESFTDGVYNGTLFGLFFHSPKEK